MWNHHGSNSVPCTGRQIPPADYQGSPCIGSGFLPVVTNGAVNIGYNYLFKSPLSIPLDIYTHIHAHPRVVMCNFLRNCQTVLQHLHCFTFPSVIHKGSDFSTSSTTLVILIRAFHVDGSNLFLVLVCISLMTNGVKPLSICLLAICTSALEKWLF